MNRFFGIRTLFAAALIAVLPLGASADDLTKLKAFEGKWRGKGSLVYSDGRPKERIVCRTTGRGSGKSFLISVRCGGGNASTTFSISVRPAGGAGRLRGSWNSRRSRGPVSFTGRVRGGTFTFRPSKQVSKEGRLDSLVIRSVSAKRYLLTARGRNFSEKVSGTLTVDFRRR